MPAAISVLNATCTTDFLLSKLRLAKLDVKGVSLISRVFAANTLSNPKYPVDSHFAPQDRLLRKLDVILAHRLEQCLQRRVENFYFFKVSIAHNAACRVRSIILCKFWINFG